MERILFGKIVFVGKEDPFYGWVKLTNGNKIILPSNALGPIVITAGPEFPEFSSELCGRRRPEIKEEVVLEVTEEDNHVIVQKWGFAEYWHEMTRIISERPVYRVKSTNKFNGQVTTVDVVTATGTLAQLARYNQNKSVDIFAPTYVSGPCVSENRWEVKNEKGEWELCSDPRPFRIFQAVYVDKEGNETKIVSGRKEEIEEAYQRNPESDALNDFSVDGGRLIWRTRRSDSRIWQECKDPRTKVKKVAPQPQPSAATNGQTILKSLADL